MKMDIALLASRSGSNARHVLMAALDGGLPFKVAAVICNGPGACALELEKSGIPVYAVNDGDFADRTAFELELLAILRQFGNPLVVSCSFNRLLTKFFLKNYPARVINSHPSLLPAFPGRPQGQKAVDAALAHGVKVVGATVHFIDETLDMGPIIIQGALPVEDEPQKTIRRVLELEAALKIQAICWLAENRVRVNGRQVQVLGKKTGEDSFFSRALNASVFPPLDACVLETCARIINPD